MLKWYQIIARYSYRWRLAIISLTFCSLFLFGWLLMYSSPDITSYWLLGSVIAFLLNLIWLLITLLFQTALPERTSELSFWQRFRLKLVILGYHSLSLLITLLLLTVLVLLVRVLLAALYL